MNELKNELFKKIKINFIVIFTSMVYTLLKNNSGSSPLRFSAIQGHAGTKNPLFRKQLMYFNVSILATTFESAEAAIVRCSQVIHSFFKNFKS